MDWKLAMKEERAMLLRIVALLCSLAGLAERSAGRSWPVRAVVLWWLRQAESVAFDFVDPPYDFAWNELQPGSPAEAHVLALCFRELAAALERQADFAFAVDGEAQATERLALRGHLARGAVHFLSGLRGFVIMAMPRFAALATGPPPRR